MAKNKPQIYLWKVEFQYKNTREREEEYIPYLGRGFYTSVPETRIRVVDEWNYASRTFTSKIAAMKFVNRLQNSSKYRYVTMKKWFGN